MTRKSIKLLKAFRFAEVEKPVLKESIFAFLVSLQKFAFDKLIICSLLYQTLFYEFSKQVVTYW
jgi:hypothetical protein